MSNAKEATARVLQEEAPMSNKDAVRKVLDAVKADKRTSLTAPEGKLVCEAVLTCQLVDRPRPPAPE